MRRITTVLMGFVFAAISANAGVVFDTLPRDDQAGFVAECGQTWRTGTLGSEVNLLSIEVATRVAGASGGNVWLAVYENAAAGNASPWMPTNLVAVSDNSLNMSVNGVVNTFTFTDAALSSTTDYLYMFVNSSTNAVGVGAGVRLNTGAGTQSAYSGGNAAFGGAHTIASRITTVAVLPPTIYSITSSRGKVHAGETVTLSWSTANEDTLTLEPGSIPVTGLTSNDVTVAADTTYWLVAANGGGTVSNSVTVGTYDAEKTVLWRRDFEELPSNTYISNNLDGAASGPYDIGTQIFKVEGGSCRVWDGAVGGRDLISGTAAGTYTNTVEITDAQYATDTQYTLEFVIGSGSSNDRTGDWFAEVGTITGGVFTPLAAVDAGAATWNLATTLNEDETFMVNTNYSDLFGYNTGGRTIQIAVDSTDAVNGDNIAIRFGTTNSAAFAGFTDMALYSEESGNVSITTFAASDTTVESGDTVTLSWSSINETSLTLNPGSVDVSSLSSTDVVITAPITYELVATGVGGPVTSQVSIAIAPLQIVYFTASDTSVTAGDTVTLSWDALSEDSLTLNPGSVDVSALSSTDVVINSDTTYELIATAGSSSVTSSVSIVALQQRPWEIDPSLIGTVHGTVQGGNDADQAGPMYGQSITINIGATTNDAAIPQTVGLKQVSFQVTSSGSGSGTDVAYLHVYDAFGVDGSGTATNIGNLIAVSTSTVDFNAVSALEEVTWTFADDEVDKGTEYFYILATDTVAATVGNAGNLTGSAFEVVTGNPYTGGQAWRANGDTTTWDLEFEVVVGAVGPQDIGTISMGTLPNGDLIIGWDSANGQTYNVLTNGNLIIESGWGLYDTVVGDGGPISFTTTPSNAQLFYKVTTP